MSTTHPNVHSAWRSWAENQTLHCVAVYSNPFRYRTRRRLFHDFRQQIEKVENVKLYVVELAYGDRPHEVTEPGNPQHIQLRTTHELWHKENLINIGVSKFDTNWQYGCYWDADTTSTRHDWALETIQLLQHYDFVQMFSSFTDMAPDHRPLAMHPSFAWNYMKRGEKEYGKLGWSESAKLAKKMQNCCCGKKPCCCCGYDYSGAGKAGMPFGGTGLGWAWRRSAFNAVGGMLDVCIVGSADWHMAYGLVGEDSHAELAHATPGYRQFILDWQRRAIRLHANVGCLDQHVIHHFHGSKVQRAYRERTFILKRHGYDPHSDLSKDWQGVLQLNGNKPGLRDDLRRYFIERDEDINVLTGGERVLV